MQQGQISGRSPAIRWIGLLFLSVVFVAALEFLRLPAALLLGPMLAAIIFSGLQKPVPVPPLAVAISQALVGCLIAKSIPLSIIGEMGRDWPIFVAGVVSVIAAGGRSAISWQDSRSCREPRRSGARCRGVLRP
jgi:uncharacterized protein